MLQGAEGGLSVAGERISTFEDRLIEIIQSEEQRKQ